MRFEELLERHERGVLTQAEVGEMLGVSERTFRRWWDRYRQGGEAGLRDRRLERPSPRRAPRSEIERMLNLYSDGYEGFSAKHFHSKGDRIYHVPGSMHYDRTRINTSSGERWFCSEAEARSAGWRAPRG